MEHILRRKYLYIDDVLRSIAVTSKISIVETHPVPWRKEDEWSLAFKGTYVIPTDARVVVT